MTIRVQRGDGRIESIELLGSDLRVFRANDVYYLTCAGTAHLFTVDGYYTGSRPVPLTLDSEHTLQS
jgi:hypothetical protein